MHLEKYNMFKDILNTLYLKKIRANCNLEQGSRTLDMTRAGDKALVSNLLFEPNWLPSGHGLGYDQCGRCGYLAISTTTACELGEANGCGFWTFGNLTWHWLSQNSIYST